MAKNVFYIPPDVLRAANSQSKTLPTDPIHFRGATPFGAQTGEFRPTTGAKF